MWSFWESELLNGSGYQSLGLEQEEFALTISLIALANALASSSGPVVPGVSSGVSLSTGSMCADLGCAEDILVGVGGLVGGCVSGLEFPEVSMRIKSNPAALGEFLMVHCE